MRPYAPPASSTRLRRISCIWEIQGALEKLADGNLIRSVIAELRDDPDWDVTAQARRLLRRSKAAFRIHTGQWIGGGGAINIVLDVRRREKENVMLSLLQSCTARKNEPPLAGNDLYRRLGYRRALLEQQKTEERHLERRIRDIRRRVAALEGNG